MLFSGKSIIIGFDSACNMRVMTKSGNAETDVKVEYIQVDKELCDSFNYAEMYKAGLETFLEKSAFTGGSIKVVLPDSFVALDYFKLPAVKTGKGDESLKIDFEQRYSNYAEMIKKFEVSHTNKNHIYHKVMLVMQDAIKAINLVFVDKKISVQYYTYSAVGVHNALLQLRPKMRKANAMIVDICPNHTEFVFTNKDKIRGYATLDFGLEVLRTDKIIYEHTIVHHDVADLAVINANEQAKAKKLTMAIDFEMETAAGQTQELSEVAPNSEIDDAIDAMAKEDGSSDEILQESINTVMLDVTKKVHYKRTKVLPQYMRREVPESDEGKVYENFRIFLKYILLYMRQCSEGEVCNDIDTVVVNLPYEYGFVVNMANLEKDENGIELTRAQEVKSPNAYLWDNLDLYGASFSNKFNKKQTF